MSAKPARIDSPHTQREMEEFASLPMRVYAHRDAWWPPDVAAELDLLSGRSPISAQLDLQPIYARRDGEVIARVSGVVSHRYNRHWNEQLGHLIHFEAMPGEDDAVVALLDEAVSRLRSRGMTAIRSGYLPLLDYPYAIDNYEGLPPFLLRATPAYYHRYFKRAGFETEKGMCDFTAELTAGAIDGYRAALAAAERAGVTIQSWREYGFLAAIDIWTDITNAAFARHWGWNPMTREEVRPMLAGLNHSPAAELSMIASVGGRPVGSVFSLPDLTAVLARIRPGSAVSPERGGSRGALINIGVLEESRGRGAGLAMAARSFLEMAQRNLRYAGYTLVLDDNWPSRRTAARLGARVTSNYVAYRRVP